MERNCDMLKKTLSAAIAVVMIMAIPGMTACKGGGNGTYKAETTTDENGSVITTAQADTSSYEPVTLEPGDKYLGGEENFSLSADKTAVSPGDTVTVTLHAENCKNVACFDLLINASAALTGAAGEEKDVGDLITTVSNTTDGILFSAIVATTISIDSLDMLTITYTVAEDAVPGDKLTVEAEFSQYLIGTDESGDQVADGTALISVEPLTLTVQ